MHKKVSISPSPECPSSAANPAASTSQARIPHKPAPPGVAVRTSGGEKWRLCGSLTPSHAKFYFFLILVLWWAWKPRVMPSLKRLLQLRYLEINVFQVISYSH